MNKQIRQIGNQLSIYQNPLSVSPINSGKYGDANPAVKTVYNVVQTDWGIGDIICSLHGIQALALKDPECEIVFYMRNQFQWAALADIPQMITKKYTERLRVPNAIFMHQPQDDKHMNSPKKLYASKLNVEPVKPNIKASVLDMPPILGGDYIVLSPFASQKNRTWAVENWKSLAIKLTSAGYKVIALDSLLEKTRCKEIGVDYYWGKPAIWVANVCRYATLIIGNDSGIAHLGGWLGIKTLVIMSQLLPEQFYDMTDNRFAISRQRCTGCRFNREFGYEDKCDSGCWVLQSVTPDDVFNKVTEWLS